MLQRFNNIVYRYDSVTSTNDVARELADSGAGEGTTVVAEEQTSGRGRLGRTWLSTKNDGLYHSIILRPDISPSDAPVLTLVIAVALAELIQEQYHLPVDIKWPNDILIGDCKLAGILAEIEIATDRLAYVIAGVGVNINQSSFPPEMALYATSLKLETGQTIDLDDFRQKLYVKLDAWYDTFLTQDATEITRRWAELSSYAEGKSVNVITGDRTISGATRGLTPAGALIVETSDGIRETILSGDVQKLQT
jgi:BirA family biotin operon repressor/biotin-[acetyl-CoA-carboxylase] ligase